MPPEPLIKVRSDLEITKQIYGGEEYYVIKDPITLKYFRLQPLEYDVFQLFDGIRTFREVKREIEAKYTTLEMPIEKIVEFVNYLRAANLIDNIYSQEHKRLYQRAKLKRNLKFKAQLFNFMYFKIPLFDPDKFLARVVKHVEFFWTKAFLLISLSLIITAIIIFITNWNAVYTSTWGLLNPKSLILIWFCVIFVKFIHELGHGFTCKHYGGEVHEMGLLFIVFTPFFYTDTSDAWIIEGRTKKMWVTAAAIYIELVLAALACIIWWATEPGLLNSLCFRIMFVASVSTIFFNGIPLLKYDGYYILSDYLEIPNLRGICHAYVAFLFRKYVLGMPPRYGEEQLFQEGRGRTYVTYGIASFLYRWFITIVIILIVARLFFALGVILAIIAVVMQLIFPLIKMGLGLIKIRKQIDPKRALFALNVLLFVLLLIAYFWVTTSLHFRKGRLYRYGFFGVIALFTFAACFFIEPIGRFIHTCAMLISKVYTRIKDTIVQISGQVSTSNYEVSVAKRSSGKGAVRLNLLITLGIIIIFLAVPVKFYVGSHCVLEPSEWAMIRVETEGFVDQLPLREGDRVEKGTLIAELSNEDLQVNLKRAYLEQEIIIKEMKIAAGLIPPQVWRVLELEYRKQQVEQQIKDIKKKIDELRIISPIKGTIVTPRMHEREGLFLPKGELLCEIKRTDTLLVRILVKEKEISDIRAGQSVKLKARAYPARVFHGYVKSISPANRTELKNVTQSARYGGDVPSQLNPLLRHEVPLIPVYEVTLEINNFEGLLKSGMTGVARIYCGKRSVAALVWRRLLRLLKFKIWV